jgi:hypothetical protein
MQLLDYTCLYAFLLFKKIFYKKLIFFKFFLFLTVIIINLTKIHYFSQPDLTCQILFILRLIVLTHLFLVTMHSSKIHLTSQQPALLIKLITTFSPAKIRYYSTRSTSLKTAIFYVFINFLKVKSLSFSFLSLKGIIFLSYKNPIS